MSFLFPRVISISRPAVQSGAGVVAYGGHRPAAETPVVSGIAASIQMRKTAPKGDAGLPADSNKTYWRIMFNLPNGAVRNRDIITDDLGIRYQVAGAYWNSLGYQAFCELLET